MTSAEYRKRLEALVDRAPHDLKVVAVVGDMISEDLTVHCSCCSTCAEGLLEAGMSSVHDDIHPEDFTVRLQ